MKWKAITIMLLIVLSLLPLYSLNKMLQSRLRPAESMGRLLVYMLGVMLVIFIYTFLLGFVIRLIFPGA